MHRQYLQQFKCAPVKAYLYNTDEKDKYQLCNTTAELTVVSGCRMKDRKKNLGTKGKLSQTKNIIITKFLKRNCISFPTLGD